MTQRRSLGPHASAQRCDLNSIHADELLPLPILKKRLGWGNRSIAQAQRDGLRAVVFGRGKYVLGRDLLAFFDRLGEQQGKGGPQT